MAFAFKVFRKVSLNRLSRLVNVLQLIMHLPLLYKFVNQLLYRDINLPGNIIYYLKMFKKFVTFQIFSSKYIIQKILR